MIFRWIARVQAQTYIKPIFCVEFKQMKTIVGLTFMLPKERKNEIKVEERKNYTNKTKSG